MNKFFVRLTILTALISNAPLIAVAAELDRERFIAHPDTIGGKIQKNIYNSFNSAMDMTFGAAVRKIILWQEKYDPKNEDKTHSCGPGQSGSTFCLAKGTLRTLRRYSEDDKKARFVIPSDSYSESDEKRDDPRKPKPSKAGLYHEFLRQLSLSEKAKLGDLDLDQIDLAKYGTSKIELESMLYNAYNRRACYLYRDAKRHSSQGDIQLLNQLKSGFDKYANKVKDTPYAVNKCRTTTNTWEEPTDEKWDLYKLPYYEKTLCREVKTLRRSRSNAVTQRALGEYISTRASMEQDGLWVNKKCLLSKQELKTLSRRPEARRVASSLQAMNHHMRKLEKENMKLEKAENDLVRARIQKRADRYLEKAKKSAKIYLRSTRKYRAKNAPKNMDQLVTQLLGLEPKNEETTNTTQSTQAVTTVSIQGLVPVNFQEQEPAQKQLPPLNIPFISDLPGPSEWANIIPARGDTKGHDSATAAEPNRMDNNGAYYSNGE